MMSLQKSNIPFYVLERQRCVNLQKICPSRGCWIFRIQGGGFDKGEGKNSGGPGVETPVGAMLWDN